MKKKGTRVEVQGADIFRKTVDHTTKIKTSNTSLLIQRKYTGFLYRANNKDIGTWLRLCSSPQKFYGHRHELDKLYGVIISVMRKPVTYVIVSYNVLQYT